ncbi:MAG: carboxymuconolactone decarboxylase family protein [Acidimicrobiales bacterium]
MTSGFDALHVLAPDAASALEGVAAAAWAATMDHALRDLAGLLSRVCTEPIGIRPLARPAGDGPARWADVPASAWRDIADLTPADRMLLAFAEQCSLDVSAVTDGQRGALLAELGARAGTVAAVVFAFDVLPRANEGLVALFGPDPDGDPIRPGPDHQGTGIWEALDALIRAVPRLDALDPVTSELVRLRGARQHRCRLCSSLRSRPALLAGADERAFAAVDDYEHSDLAPGQQAALAFTDAMLWTPGRIDGTLVGALESVLSPEQRVELVLDVTRNAVNKVAVALGADAPHVDEGIEIYDVDEDGELVYGLRVD